MPAPPLPSPGSPSTPAQAETQAGRMLIDLAPIRREIFRQIVPEGTFENMTPEERQKVAQEVNQRMLGVVQGIKLGATELQKLAETSAADAQKKSAEAAAAGALLTPPPPPAAPASVPAAPKPAPAPELTRRSSVSAGRIDVQIQRNGQVVRRVNAEINIPNVMATVFSTTRRDSGEVPFAVAKDGTIYTVTTADKARIADFGPVATPGGPATARVGNWIVVTTEETSGTGLRLGIARPVGDSLADLRRTTARNAGFGLLFIALALVGIAPLSSRLTRNLTTMSAAVHRIAKGDYAARVPVKSRDEIGELAAAFNQMAGDVERHQRAAVEQERIRRELELGRQIQAEMLPHAPLKLGLTEVQGVSVPAREVGGDFFNYFVLSSGDIALLVGDVSGKGVGAALLMANIQASLRTRLALGQDLSAVAREIDLDIEENSPGPVYATLFVGILDPKTRQLRYVNAGHHPQYVLRSEGGLHRMPATGLPVGLFAGHGYTQESVQLAPNDLIFFYTDGCVEAENDAGEMFGADRLEALLKSAAGAPDALHQIESGIATFRQRREPFDDATLMTVRVG
jgi:serine phosphatase RsbU (regulator of sigma subunit)